MTNLRSEEEMINSSTVLQPLDKLIFEQLNSILHNTPRAGTFYIILRASVLGIAELSLLHASATQTRFMRSDFDCNSIKVLIVMVAGGFSNCKFNLYMRNNKNKSFLILDTKCDKMNVNL